MYGKNSLVLKQGTNSAICILLVAMLLPLLGCEEQYKGTTFKPPVDKIVIFEIKGTDGKDFTQRLGTEMNALGKAVVYGSQYGDPIDSIAAAKIARDCKARAYIVGDITQSDFVKDAQYEVHSTFTLHDAQAGEQMGGIIDAHISKNLDLLGGAVAGGFDSIESIFGKKTNRNKEEYAEKLKKTIAEQKPLMYQELAGRVAVEMTKGLGRGSSSGSIFGK